MMRLRSVSYTHLIFSLGPWRYFKERTWLGRFLRFIKRWTLNALNVFNENDWERRSTKIIGKAIIANFVILTIICLLYTSRCV